MTTVTFTEFRSGMAQLMDKAEQDFQPIIVSRPKGKKSVVIPLSEYESLLETAYLLQNSANQKHLQESLQELEKGELIPFQL